MKWIIGLYFVLNVLSTYLLTSPLLNESITPFKTNILYESLSVIGNGIILLLILVIGMFFIKKNRTLVKYLIFVTFILNVLLLLLSYYTKNYKTMLSFYNLSLFRNPNAGFAIQIFLDGLYETVFSVQMLCILPVLLFFVFYLIKRKNLLGKTNINIRNKITMLLVSLFISLSSITFFRYQLQRKWPYRIEVPQYGIQMCGVYNYYFAELFIGVDYSDNFYRKVKDEDSDVASFDKNNPDNLNIIDSKKYENGNVGILEGMNLFVIQAEALQNFTISYEFDGKLLMPHINELMKDENMFYFSNTHTIVGIGNTSDAEFSFNTGYYPLGDLTINWEAYDKMFDIQSLPKMFGEEYISYSYNPTIEGFYAHKYIHENFYKFNRFVGFESYEKLYPYDKNHSLYLNKKWVSDEAILEYALQESKKVIEEGKKSYTFAQTIAPHYPFVDISDNYSNQYDYINFKGATSKFNNYLNQIRYNDKVLADFLLKAKDELKDTVFIIYGDHGNSLSKKSYENLFSKEFNYVEYQKMLLEIPVFIYDPSGKINEYINSIDIDTNYMLNRTLSQIDLFQTVKSMFNLESEVSLGVNLFSNESSFAINSKTLDIIADEFYYIVKNDKYYLSNNITFNDMINIIEKIKRFKMANDIELTKKMKTG